MKRRSRWKTIGGCDGSIAESDAGSAWINQVAALPGELRFVVNLHVGDASRIGAYGDVTHWVDEAFKMPSGPAPVGGLSLVVQIDGRTTALQLGGRRSGGGVDGEIDELVWELGLQVGFEPADRLTVVSLDWPKAALQGTHAIDLEIVRAG